MSYPSIISQPGSAARNLEPVLEALTPLIEGSSSSSTSTDSTSSPSGPAKRILELASYPYEHIRGYARKWPSVNFTGTVRDEHELSTTNTTDLPSNVRTPLRLDIAQEEDWAKLCDTTEEPYEGVIMLNLVHCTPEGLPENIFRNLSPKLKTGRRILAPGGWIAAYGAYLNDDGSFRSPADAKFDAEYIKGMHPSLGLRTPKSITEMAERWGFREVERRDMPKGNLWIVWKAERFEE